jgi:hypothetical protein
MANCQDDPHTGLRAAPPAEFARPERSGRRVFATAELTSEEIARFEKTQMHPRHKQLNAELDEPALQT